jgi:hypothetical protein
MNKLVKKIIIIGVVVILGLFAYRFFFVRVDEEALNAIGGETSAVGREVLALLSELRAIELTGGIFEREDFRSLEDFGVAIQPDTIGRRNPFAPIGVSNFESISQEESPATSPTTTPEISEPEEEFDTPLGEGEEL